MSDTLGYAVLELRLRPIIVVPSIRRAVFALESRMRQDHWSVISYHRTNDDGDLEEIDLDD